MVGRSTSAKAANVVENLFHIAANSSHDIDEVAIQIAEDGGPRFQVEE